MGGHARVTGSLFTGGDEEPPLADNTLTRHTSTLFEGGGASMSVVAPGRLVTRTSNYAFAECHG